MTIVKRILGWGAAIIALLVAVVVVSWNVMFMERDYPTPVVSDWTPEGVRNVGHRSAVHGPNLTFQALHADLSNSDEILLATAPQLELAWHVEDGNFIPDGPIIDEQGDVYFSPVNPVEDLALVGLDGETGKRKWAITGKSQGGSPLLLRDPENPGAQIVYLGLYDRAMAVRTDGTVLWDVPTGLPTPDVKGDNHNFGLNYHEGADALISALMDGRVYALDRKTGKPVLRNVFELPGVPAAGSGMDLPEETKKRIDKHMEKTFGVNEAGGRFTRVTDAVWGGGSKVANYFSIDPNTGRLYMAATSPDDKDGVLDGRAEWGAIYALELTPDGDGFWKLDVVAEAAFPGGTGSTPALTPDGRRIYTSDEKGNVLALDRDLNLLWTHDIGEQVLASITVAAENNELYAVTAGGLYQFFDRGDRAESGWTAKLDMYPEFFGHVNMNNLTATIAANGIAVVLGHGFEKGEVRLPLGVGVGMLDRATGDVVSYTPGLEESVATTAVAPDGGILLGHSPLRRAVTSTLLGGLVPDLLGGVARYRPARYDLVVRDAACAAALRLDHAVTQSANPESAKASADHAGHLFDQVVTSIKRAQQKGELSADSAKRIAGQTTVLKSALVGNDHVQAGTIANALCQELVGAIK